MLYVCMKESMLDELTLKGRAPREDCKGKAEHSLVKAKNAKVSPKGKYKTKLLS